MLTTAVPPQQLSSIGASRMCFQQARQRLSALPTLAVPSRLWLPKRSETFHMQVRHVVSGLLLLGASSQAFDRISEALRNARIAGETAHLRPTSSSVHAASSRSPVVLATSRKNSVRCPCGWLVKASAQQRRRECGFAREDVRCLDR